MIALFDIGGTSIKYGVADENREGFFLVGSGETDSNAKKIKGQGIEKKVIQLTEKMAGQYAISGISISTAGMVDAAKGRIVYANENIPEYTGLDWKTDIQTYLHLPCEVENDVNAAALGEYVYGAGAGSRSMLMMTIGTGIGGAIIQDGRILRGHTNSAGEIGYMYMDGKAFQDIASTTALVQTAQKLIGEKELNGRIIFKRAMEGDKICAAAIEDICRKIAAGIFNCVCLLNPEVVLLGGGIMEQKEYLRPILDKCLRDIMTEETYKHMHLEFAALKNQAGLAGAYYHFLIKNQIIVR